MKPDVIGFDAAISACEKGQQWKQASSVLQEMWTSQRTPDVISYNSAISACEKGQQSEQALSLLLEMWTSHLALVAYVPCRAVRRAPAADCGHWRWSPPRRWGRRNTRRTSDEHDLARDDALHDELPHGGVQDQRWAQRQGDVRHEYWGHSCPR